MTNSQATSSRLLAYLQLMRLPNVFTAMADVMMGFWFYRTQFSPILPFSLSWPDPVMLLMLLASSCCLYTAGIVLNDVFDIEVDRLERPSRPLPSGRVYLTAAKRLGWVLSIAGVVFGSLAMRASAATGQEMTWGQFLVGHGRPVVVAVVLLSFIVGYDRWLKRTPLGPFTMGGCRSLNVLLGMSASPLPWTIANYAVAAGVGVYVVGVTVFARQEVSVSRRRDLIFAFLIASAGMGAIWWLPTMMGESEKVAGFNFLQWSIAWIPIVVLIGWRFIIAIIRPEPARVQAAVKSGIMSIIVLDAMAAFVVGGFWTSTAILLLLVPANIIGRWVYSI